MPPTEPTEPTEPIDQGDRPTESSSAATESNASVDGGWSKTWRRIGVLLLAVTVIVLLTTWQPALHLLLFQAADVNQREPLPEGMAGDASRLDATRIYELWESLANASMAERIESLRELLLVAAKGELPVSIAGARHSMGGHTICKDGIQIDTSTWRAMELDAARGVLRVDAGARWADVLAYLDPLGYSVQVMQSNNSFSVGGSISVNCHGWQHGMAPIASTVESFRIMLADGDVRRCSREQNQELFGLALGGYGLFGIILDVELRVARNERYQLRQRVVPTGRSLAAYDQLLAEPGVQMAYARLNIVPDTLFDEAIVNVFVRKSGDPPPLESQGLQQLRRAIFRGSAENDYGKELRWSAETKLQPWIQNTEVSRNQLLNEGVEVFENRTQDTTDILHEYFVPRRNVAPFVAEMKRLLEQHKPNLLNVTVRSVERDDDTVLRYAPEPMLCFVMLFVQKQSTEGEQSMQRLTRDLIDASLASEGRFYLPYRLHATQQQFEAAYPQADQFFARKRHYDPELRFQNRFFQRYMTHTE